MLFKFGVIVELLDFIVLVPTIGLAVFNTFPAGACLIFGNSECYVGGGRVKETISLYPHRSNSKNIKFYLLFVFCTLLIINIIFA